MARNDDRRRRLADAGLTVLALEGARGLTHRAIDDEAGVPPGTTSNFFRSRSALIAGIFSRIDERLAPDPATLRELEERPPSRELFAAYIGDIVRRLTASSEVTLAWFELRLEAMRHPELAEQVGEWQRRNFAGDVAFNAKARLPGGPEEIALLHYAIDGLLLDRLTMPIDPDTPVDVVVEDLVRRLLA